MCTQVGDHEVECQAHFRMYLHTTTQPHLIPGELAAYVSVIYFHQTRYDVEEELLERFMHREKVRMDEEKTALLEVSVHECGCLSVFAGCAVLATFLLIKHSEVFSN